VAEIAQAYGIKDVTEVSLTGSILDLGVSEQFIKKAKEVSRR